MKRILQGFIALLTIALIISCSTSNNKTSTQTQASVPQTTPASQNTGPTFTALDLNGGTHTFAEYTGKGPLMVNFWGTWCPPCRMELPDLVRIYKEYKPKGLEIVGLAVKDTPDKVKQFAAQNNLNWVMLMGNMDALVSFGATQGVPTTIFYNKDGVEVSRFIGARSYEDFKAQVEKII